MTSSNLHEGLIKLPPGLLEALQDFTLKWYFAHVFAEIEKRHRFDDETLERAHRIVSSAAREHDAMPTQEQIRIARKKTAFIKTFGTDEQVYHESLPKVKLKVQLDRQSNLHGNLGLYRDHTAFITVSPFNMHMTGQALRTLSSLRYALSKVPELIGTLEHELTHLIQYRTLSKKSERQIGIHDDYSLTGEVDAAWALSDIEFDPAIKSARGELKKLESKYKSFPGYNKESLRDAFLGVGKVPEFMHPNDTSHFFELLKSLDSRKWRKAVKLFMTAH